MSLSRFKSAVKRGQPVPDGVLRKALVTTVDGLDDHRVGFTISTGAVDRDNDRVSLEGWELDAYKANPVVLWGHNSWEMPIGRCVAIGVEGDALKAVVEFVPADMPHIGDRAEAVLRMCRTGFLSATSVGFRPLSYELAKERMGDDDWFPPIDFTRQELMEFSVCSIPANPEALIDPAERVTQAASAGPAREHVEAETTEGAARAAVARRRAILALAC